MSKKFGLIMLIAVMILSTILAACSKPATTPATQSPQGTTTQPAQPSVKWRFHTISAAGETEVQAFQGIADEVSKRTNGKFIIEIFPSSSLGFSEADVLRVLKQDGVEIAHSFNSRVAGDEPIATVSEIPFLATKPEDIVAANKAVIPMWNEIMGKWNGKWLLSWSAAMAPLTATKKVTKVEDWKGIKIRTQSDTMSKVIQLMGASAVSVPFAEAYSATATGIVEAHFWSPGTIYSQKMYELCHFMNEWTAMAFGSVLVVNTTAYNKLPKEYQDILTNAAKQWEDWLWQEEFWGESKSIDDLKATGKMEIIPVSVEENTKAANMVLPVYDDWLKKAGPDGLKWLNTVLQAVGKPAYK